MEGFKINDFFGIPNKSVEPTIRFEVFNAKTRRTLSPWVHISVSSKKYKHKKLFGLFASRTFDKGDTVGYLRGKTVWTQKGKSTTGYPTEVKFGPPPNTNLCHIDFLVRNRDFMWTIQRVFCMNEVQEVDLHMGMHYIQGLGTGEESGNISVKDDGEVYTTKKINVDEEIFGKLPKCNWCY